MKNASLYGLIEKKRVHSAKLLFQTMLTSGRMEPHLCIYRFSKACQLGLQFAQVEVLQFTAGVGGARNEFPNSR